jgi:hypothetical protein
LDENIRERFRPSVLAHEQVLPVVDALADLLPGHGLQRGSVIATRGPAAMSIGLALLAGASAAGSWLGIVGLTSIGLSAATELGIALERVFLVAQPPITRWAETLAAVADGAELILARVPPQVRPSDIRRVRSRLSTRGAVLLLAGPEEHAAIQADVVIGTSTVRWEGIGAGAGRLLARQVQVEAGGRRAGRPLRRTVWLPGVDGSVSAVTPVTGAGSRTADIDALEQAG